MLNVDVYLMQAIVLLVVVPMCLSKLALQTIEGPLKFTNVVLHADKPGIHGSHCQHIDCCPWRDCIVQFCGSVGWNNSINDLV
jgi:hypothetical protein